MFSFMTSPLFVGLISIIQVPATQPATADEKTSGEWIKALSDSDREASIKLARSFLNALSDTDPAVRRRAVLTMHTGIVHFIADPRNRVAEVLAQIGPDAKRSVPELVALLSDPDRNVRFCAGNCLGALGPAAASAIPDLLPHLGARDGVSAEIALGQIGPTAIPPLVARLTSGTQDVRIAAATAFEVMGAKARPALPALLAALQQDDTRLQYQILSAIGEMGPDAAAAVPMIIDHLKSKDIGVRAEAAQALARIGPAAKAAVPTLIAMLKDDGQQLEFWTRVALRQIGQAAVPALKLAIKDENSKVRASAEGVLREIVPVTPADVASAVQNLRDPAAAVRRATIAALIRPETLAPEATAALIEVAKKDSDLQNRLDAQAALAKGGQKAVAALAAALDDRQPAIVYSAARALGAIGPDARPAVPSLIKLCKSPDQELRQVAALALGRIGPAAVPAIGELFNENHGAHQETAAIALNEIGAAAVPTLVEALEKGNVESRRVAARALIMSRPAASSALPALVKAVNDRDTYVRTFALGAIAALGPDAEAAVAVLRECLRDPERRMQSDAAAVLREIGPAAKDAIPDLIHALNDAGAASFASQALANIGPPAVPALKAALESKNERARTFAAEALKSIDAKARAKTGSPPSP